MTTIETGRAAKDAYLDALVTRGHFADRFADDVTMEAAAEDEATTLAARLQPYVVLMDLHVPERNGFEATRQLAGTNPHIGILVLTMYEDDDSVFAAMLASAREYLLKCAPRAETLRATRAIASGKAISSPVIAGRLMGFFGAIQPETRTFSELTDREREILALIAQGRRNEEIAAQLCLSIKTVRNHASNIFGKLQVVDRVQAAIRAREAGLARCG